MIIVVVRKGMLRHFKSFYWIYKFLFIVIPGPALRADLGVDLVIEVVLHVPDLVLEIALEAVPDLETNLKIDHLIGHLKNHKMRNAVLILQMIVAEVHLLVTIVQEAEKKKKNVLEVIPLQLLLVVMIAPGEKRK